MRGTILSLIIFASLPSWATWTMVQHTFNAACASANTTCAITVSSTGSGNLIVVETLMGTATSNPITSVSGGGTYTHCSNCQVIDTAGPLQADASYALSSSSGATTITITMTNTTTGGAWKARAIEYSVSPGNVAVLDAGAVPSGNRDQSTAAVNAVGVALTLSGTTDLVTQFCNCGGTVTAINNSYTNSDFSGRLAGAELLNTSSGVAPTWTQTSARAALLAIAFTETTAGAAAPTQASPFVVQ